MLTDPAHEWTVDGLAETASMSRAKFMLAFVRVAGVSPRVLLTQVRMELAVKPAKPFTFGFERHYFVSRVSIPSGFQQRTQGKIR
jgi:AraC family transcriptional activator of mtrCDE